MRYVSISRHNSLFFGSNKGAERSAFMLSLAISCKLNNLNTFEYFDDILAKLVDIPRTASYETLRGLLPDKWQKE